MSGCQHAVVPRRPEPEHVTRLIYAVHDLLDSVDATLPEFCPPLVRSAAGALLDAVAAYHRDSGYPERRPRPEGSRMIDNLAKQSPASLRAIIRGRQETLDRASISLKIMREDLDEEQRLVDGMRRALAEAEAALAVQEGQPAPRPEEAA